MADFHGSAAPIAKLFPAGMDREKFTCQMANHLPLSTQINTDNDANQLKQLVQG